MPKRFPYATSVILGLILAPVSSNVVKFFQAKALIGSAIALERQNITNDINREKAIAKYREAIKLAPYYGNAHYNLAYALQLKGLKEEAIAEYRAVIRTTPNFAPAYQDLGEMLEAQGKLQEAFTNYFQAIRKDPEFIDPRVKLGTLLEKQGRLDEAIAQYRELIRIDPNDAYANKDIGIILYKQGKRKEAIPYLNVSINEYKRVNFQNTYSEEIKEIEDTLQAIGEQ